MIVFLFFFSVEALERWRRHMAECVYAQVGAPESPPKVDAAGGWVGLMAGSLWEVITASPRRLMRCTTK